MRTFALWGFATLVLTVLPPEVPAEQSPYSQLIAEVMRAGDFPAVTGAVVARGEVVWVDAVGHADLASGRAMTVETPIYIGSLSKVFTALLVRQLIEEGELGLDDESVAGDSHPPTGVSIRHLLQHASGYSREGDFGYWFSGDFPDRDALRSYLALHPPDFAPGSRVRYSNIGYAAIGLHLEHLLGQSFDEAVSDRVLVPLALGRTGAAGTPADVAVGYTPAGSLVPSDARPFAGVGRAIGDRHERNYHRARAMTPAFGMYSTISDMAQLVRHLLQPENAELSSPLRGERAPRRATRRDSLGMRHERLDGRSVSRHDGWFAAHRAHILLDGGRDLGVVVMTNSDDAVASRIAENLLRLARRAEEVGGTAGD